MPLLEQTTTTESDIDRLQPHLSSTGKLNEVLMLDTVTDDDLRKMLIIESYRDKPRRTIVRKLLGRLYRREYSYMMRLIFPNET